MPTIAIGIAPRLRFHALYFAFRFSTADCDMHAASGVANLTLFSGPRSLTSVP